jgi:hypothetical protein
MLYQHHRSQAAARRNLRIHWSSNAKAFGMTVPAMLLAELTWQSMGWDRCGSRVFSWHDGLVARLGADSAVH